MLLLPFLLALFLSRDAQYETAHALLHQGLVVDIWCCCSHFLVVVVAIIRCVVEMAPACAQGLVVVAVVRHDIENGVPLHLRPCCCCHCVTRR